MTKHELLQYLSESGWATSYDVAREFNLTHAAMFSRFETLRAGGFVKRKRFKNETGNLNYHYSLSPKGLNKLYYFDERGCKKPECICTEER